MSAEIAVLVPEVARPSSVGRLLRRQRLAAGLSQTDAALAMEVLITRVKELEAGRSTLGYLEGLRLAKAYLLCPPCFRRAFEAAVEREGLEGQVRCSGNESSADGLREGDPLRQRTRI